MAGQVANLIERSLTKACAGTDEDVRVGRGFLGAVGQRDIKDRRSEAGVIAKVTKHLRHTAGVGVGVIVHQDDELCVGFANSDIFSDRPGVLGKAGHVDGREVLGNEVGRAVGGGVINDPDIKLRRKEAVGEGSAEAVDNNRPTIVGGDSEGDKRLEHPSFIDPRGILATEAKAGSGNYGKNEENLCIFSRLGYSSAHLSRRGGANRYGTIFMLAKGSREIVMAVVDKKGKVITGGTYNLTLSLVSGPIGMDSAFTPVTIQTVNGVAVFDGVTADDRRNLQVADHRERLEAGADARNESESASVRSSELQTALRQQKLQASR